MPLSPPPFIISSGQKGGEQDGEGSGGEDGRDGVPDAQDGVVLVIRPGQLLVPTLELDQQRPATAKLKISVIKQEDDHWDQLQQCFIKCIEPQSYNAFEFLNLIFKFTFFAA